jgi:hypothetical protein
MDRPTSVAATAAVDGGSPRRDRAASVAIVEQIVGVEVGERASGSDVAHGFGEDALTPSITHGPNCGSRTSPAMSCARRFHRGDEGSPHRRPTGCREQLDRGGGPPPRRAAPVARDRSVLCAIVPPQSLTTTG